MGSMTAAAAGYSKNGRASLASRFVVFLVVLVFAFQSYVAQTHIHGQAQSLYGVAKIAAAPSPMPGKLPLDNSPTDCPFCQAVNLAGAFITPAALLFQLPQMWVASVTHIVIARDASGAVAHDWKSRAPPRR